MTSTELYVMQLEHELAAAKQEAGADARVTELEEKLGRVRRAHAKALELHGAWPDGSASVRIPVGHSYPRAHQVRRSCQVKDIITKLEADIAQTRTELAAAQAAEEQYSRRYAEVSA